jgi:hypothetical protein
MNLEQICDAIAEVVQDLMFHDDISVSYKADILDDILSIIGDDVAERKEPDLWSCERMLSELISFQDAHDIDLRAAIDGLKKYISSKEEQ